jgi:hypothetical protein
MLSMEPDCGPWIALKGVLISNQRLQFWLHAKHGANKGAVNRGIAPFLLALYNITTTN